MKTISSRLFCASLIFAASCLDGVAADNGSLPRASKKESQSVVVASLQTQRTRAGMGVDADQLKALRAKATQGSAEAKARLADALLDAESDEAALAEARSLYKEAAESGIAGAYLGLAKLGLRESSMAESRHAAREQLLEASARGNAEADRLLAKLRLQDAGEVGCLADAWSLLVRAGEKDDADACIELAEAYLTGSWNGLAVSVDESEARRMLAKASNQRVPQAALSLCLLLSQGWMATVPEDFDESVRQLYNALLWSDEYGAPLFDEAQRLHDQGRLYTRTWLRASYLYDQAIHPQRAERASKARRNNEVTIVPKIREGVCMIEQVAGAADGPSLSVLGFPYDAPYLWDGAVTLSEDGTLAVAEDDPFWSQARRRLQSNEGGAFFVKVLEGDYAGMVLNVSAEWGKGETRQIVTEEVYPYVFMREIKVALGQWRSMYSVFGRYNSAGLRPGTCAAEADQIILLDAQSQKFIRYFFNNELMAWVSSDEPDEAVADFALPPWQALFVLRREETPLYLTLNGVFSNAPAFVPVDSGMSLIANQEGRLLDDLDAAAYSFCPIRADDFPVFTVDDAGNIIPFEDGTVVSWWQLLGIAADTPLFMNYPSALLITSPEQASPSFIQR